MRRRVETRLEDERGFTLPELLIATVLAMIVIGGAVAVFTVSVRNQPRLTSHANAIQQARVTMERITRELRQGSTLPTTPTASQLSIVTYVDSATCGGAGAASSIQCRVTYTCASGTCTRRETKPDGTSPGPSVQVVSGLASDNIFSYTAPTATAPAYVNVTLAYAAQGGTAAITLNDGAALRNPSGIS